ncbi:Hypothetical predicted protein, partial [Pelobates cultripes]
MSAYRGKKVTEAKDKSAFFAPRAKQVEQTESADPNMETEAACNDEGETVDAPITQQMLQAMLDNAVTKMQNT